MALKDLAAHSGRLCMIVAAFVLVAGIVAGPLVQKILFPQSISHVRNSPGPILNPNASQVTAAAEKQG